MYLTLITSLMISQALPAPVIRNPCEGFITQVTKYGEVPRIIDWPVEARNFTKLDDGGLSMDKATARHVACRLAAADIIPGYFYEVLKTNVIDGVNAYVVEHQHELDHRFRWYTVVGITVSAIATGYMIGQVLP